MTKTTKIVLKNGLYQFTASTNGRKKTYTSKNKRKLKQHLRVVSANLPSDETVSDKDWTLGKYEYLKKHAAGNYTVISVVPGEVLVDVYSKSKYVRASMHTKRMTITVEIAGQRFVFNNVGTRQDLWTTFLKVIDSMRKLDSRVTPVLESYSRYLHESEGWMPDVLGILSHATPRGVRPATGFGFDAEEFDSYVRRNF